MNVNQIEAMALGRIANPDAIRRVSLRAELQGAYEGLVQEVRDADTEIADDVQLFDLTAGLNTYPIPIESEFIRRVERLDMAGVGLSTPVAVVCRPIPFQQFDRAYRLGSPTYCLAPTGMVLIPTPANDYVQGIRITWLPVAEDLLEDDQVPRLPKQLHDPLAALLLRRLLSLAGVQAGSQGVGDWIAEQQRSIINYLNPSGREAITRFNRTLSIYGPRRP
jgi:hypothetical protein